MIKDKVALKEQDEINNNCYDMTNVLLVQLYEVHLKLSDNQVIICQSSMKLEMKYYDLKV